LGRDSRATTEPKRHRNSSPPWGLRGARRTEHGTKELRRERWPARGGRAQEPTLPRTPRWSPARYAQLGETSNVPCARQGQGVARRVHAQSYTRLDLCNIPTGRTGCALAE